MSEKTYKTMGGSGALNIVVGTVSIVTGIACGVLLKIITMDCCILESQFSLCYDCNRSINLGKEFAANGKGI